MTASEGKLWKALRALKLGIRRQAPMGRYIADFIHHGARLVIEVDGARHRLPEAQINDLERDAWFSSQGYCVLRVSDQEAFGRPWDLAAAIGALITGRQDAGAQPRPSTGIEPTPHPQPFPIEGKGAGKALPLNGGGLGGGVGAGQTASAPMGSDLSQPTNHIPSSPTLSPSWGKGE